MYETPVGFIPWTRSLCIVHLPGTLQQGPVQFPGRWQPAFSSWTVCFQHLFQLISWYAYMFVYSINLCKCVRLSMRLHICTMYVCMHAHTRVCMYVRMYSCMYLLHSFGGCTCANSLDSLGSEPTAPQEVGRRTALNRHTILRRSELLGLVCAL